MARWRRWACAGLGCAIACGGVRAELLSTYFPDGVPGYGTAPGVTVASRARPEYAPPGVRMDSFVFHPTMDESMGYNDNVLAAPSGQQGSWLIGTKPSLLVNSDWSRDSLGAYLGLDNESYLNLPAQSFANWTASLGGTVAVGRDQLTIGVSHFALHQLRTDLDPRLCAWLESKDLNANSPHGPMPLDLIPSGKNSFRLRVGAPASDAPRVKLAHAV